MSCSACGADNGPDARYCSACGRALPWVKPLEGERKYATVLFADVAGSTALAERLRPEAWAELTNEAFGFLDHASVESVDVRQGLEDTPVILRHRLRGGGSALGAGAGARIEARAS